MSGCTPWPVWVLEVVFCGEWWGGCLGGVCMDRNFFLFLFSPYLYYSVGDSVSVDSSFWPRLLFLGFPPLLLWACLQVAYKVLFVVRVKQAILWAATLWLQAVTVVQSQEPSWSGRGTDGACSLEYCTLIFEGKKGSERWLFNRNIMKGPSKQNKAG